MFCGYYPAQHGVKYTLEEDMPAPEYPQVELPTNLKNVASVMAASGYDVVYKGKWHISKPEGSEFAPSDLKKYGFDRWNPPDAGADQSIEQQGGGLYDHDGRFMDHDGDVAAGEEGVLQYLNTRKDTDKPFCLIVSLVNPHDCLSYPNQYDEDGGYEEPGDPWLAPTDPAIELPPTVDEDLSGKPDAQTQALVVIAGGLGPLITKQRQQNYLNFYGRLMMAVDNQMGQLLDVLDPDGDGSGPALQDVLIIRTSDHGEMGMAHRGLRQKAFVAYEETLRVPLIWSNPDLFPEPKTTDAMVSHVDLLPTLCSLTGVPDWQAKGFKGVDYSHVVLDPDQNQSATAAQPYVLFTFDDIFAAADEATVGPEGAVPPPNRIQALRTPDFKLVRYWDGSGTNPPAPDQGEFYDLRPTGGDYYANDGAEGATVYNAPGPLETINLSDVGFVPPVLSPDQAEAYASLQGILAAETAPSGRLAETPVSGPEGPKQLKLQVVRWEEDEVDRVAVQVTFYSHVNTRYQVQKSTDLASWSDIGEPIIGNNGPVIFNEVDALETKAFYRVVWSALDVGVAM